MNKQTAALLREIGTDTASFPAGCNIHLFPDGSFAANDGRPSRNTDGAVTHWVINQGIAQSLIEASASKPILIDQDHESRYGSTAAKGWITALHYEPGRGLFGKAEFIGETATEIKNKVWRYQSPMFVFDGASGAVLDLLSVALTNQPALDDLQAIAARQQSGADKQHPNPCELQEQTMTTTPIRTAALAVVATNFGIDLTSATDQHIAEARQKVETKRDEVHTAALSELQGKLKQAEVDLAALKAEQESREKDALIAQATKEGKLTPALADWAKEQPIASLRTFIENTTPIAALNSQQTKTAGKEKTTPDGGLDEAQIALCKTLGMTQEEYKTQYLTETGASS